MVARPWEGHPRCLQNEAEEAEPQDGAEEAGAWEIAMTREQESERLAAIQERGVTVTELTDEQYQAFVDATQSVYEKWTPRIGEEVVNVI